ncbi:MAG TPA: class B sortase [Clostridiales bacterium]|nr:class B sortase [Clostridiales bacterium]
MQEYKEGVDVYEELNLNYVSTPDVSPETEVPTADSPSVGEDPAPAETPVVISAPVTVDFDSLLSINPDVVGWLYCENTEINLPVAQADDNFYYLNRLINGTINSSGTLFLDYRVSSDFSGKNSIIYGHNMKNKSMFGNLDAYKEQSYYDEHPVMYLLTPEQDYMVKLFSGYETDTSSSAFTFEFEDEDDYAQHLAEIRAMSLFESDVAVTSEDRILTLSTCSDNYSYLRFVLIGRLVPIG